MNSLGNNYERIFRVLAEGDVLDKLQALKRLNTLSIADRKQFLVVSKRILQLLQTLLKDYNADIIQGSLSLMINLINQAPRQSQSVMKVKLMPLAVQLLGHRQANIRKCTHTFFLTATRTFRCMDALFSFYLKFGLDNVQDQVRQKVANSLQSIAMVETRQINFTSEDFKRLLMKLLVMQQRDQSAVRKAVEQCLIFFCKQPALRNTVKLLQPDHLQKLRQFFYHQRQIGVLDSETTIEDYQSERKFIQKEIRDRLKLTVNQSIKPLDHSQPLKEVQQPHPQFAVIKHSIESILSQKDWKKRLQLMQELNIRLHREKQKKEFQSLATCVFPLIVKLISDSNFKVSLLAVKIIDVILQNKELQHLGQSALPDFLQKLGDFKLSVRQSVLRILKIQFFRKSPFFQDCILSALKKTNGNPAHKQQLLILLTQNLGQQGVSVQRLKKLMQDVVPILQQQRLKLKLKALQCLCAAAGCSDEHLLYSKHYLQSRVNKIYYQMFLQKLQKTKPLPMDKQTKAQKLSIYQKNVVVENKDLKPVQDNQQQHLLVQSSSLKPLNQPHNRASLLLSSDNLREEMAKSSLPSIQKFQRERVSSVLQSLSRNRYRPQPKIKIKQKSLRIQPQSEVLRRRESDDEVVLPVINSFSLKKQHKRKKDLLNTSSTSAAENTDSRSEVNRSDSQSFFNSPPKRIKKLSIRNQSRSIAQDLNNPQNDLKQLLSNLKNQDWQKNMDGLSAVKELLASKVSFFNTANLKQIVFQVTRIAQSLRSSLAKNALQTLTQLSRTLKRVMDSQCQQIFSKLLRRTMDANNFICQQVKKALSTMSQNSQQTSVITSLFNFHTSKSQAIKLCVMHLIQLVVQIPRYLSRQSQRIIKILSGFMGEGSSQLRSRAKAALNSLAHKGHSDSIRKYLAPQFIKKINLADPTTVQPIHPPASVQRTLPLPVQVQAVEQQPRVRTKVILLNMPPQLNQLDQINKRLVEPNWKQRLSGIQAGLGLLRKYPEAFCLHRSFINFFDVLNKSIADPNNHVQTSAVKGMLQLISSASKQTIQSFTNVICVDLINMLLKQGAQQVFIKLSQKAGYSLIGPYLLNSINFSNVPKHKLKILKHIQEKLDRYVLKTNFAKNLGSLIMKLLDQNKLEYHQSIKEIVGKLRILDSEPAVLKNQQIRRICD